MIDMHIHTCYSDGTDTLEELFDKLIEKNIMTFSITDHDNIVSFEKIKKYETYLKEKNIRYIPGVEISCACGKTKMHLLAYGYTNSSAINELIDQIRVLRLQRVLKRIENLKTIYGIELTEEEINEILSFNNPSKPHIANILIRKKYVKSIDEAIKKYMSEKLEDKKLQAEEVVKKLHSVGISVGIAHPLGGEGESRISSKDFENNVKLLKPLGLNFVECYYSLYNEDEREIIKTIAKKYDLYVSGGSDYHGENKNISLGYCGENYIPDKKDFTILKIL